MIEQALLEECGTRQVEGIVSELDDGHFHFDTPALIEHMRQANTPDLLRQLISDETV